MTSCSLFVHSTATFPTMWSPFLHLAEPLGRPIAAANVGYPPNSPLPRGSAVTVRDDTAELLRAIPHEHDEVHVIAHSYGGVIALDLVRELGPRVRSLLLYEPVIFGSVLAASDADPEARAALATQADDRAFLHDDACGGDERWIAQFIEYWNRPGAWARMAPARQDEIRAVGWKMYQEAQSVFFETFDLDGLIARDVPLTLVYGDGTRPEARAAIELLRDRTSHAFVHELAGTGHMAPLSHPRLFAGALRDHVARVVSR